MYKITKGKGFTLTEILVVIFIIALLSSLAIIVFSVREQSAKDSVAEGNLRAALGITQNFYVARGGSYGGEVGGDNLPAYISNNSTLSASSLPLEDDPPQDAKTSQIFLFVSANNKNITLRIRSGSKICRAGSSEKISCS